MSLEDAVWEVLGTQRLRQLVLGGFAPVQILERLPPDVVGPLSAQENATLARREALDAIVLALDGLVEQGRVKRGRAKLNTAFVDVYRRSLRA